ncbi:MAG: hypothetical protein N4A71_22120 [Carboxylicivirga sp.]|jgi:hypothetical protein|nr:hypothetical protein [Carboxylicivirga sp.]
MAVYLIKTKIQPKADDPNMNFKPLVMSGVFVPKGKQTARTKIEEQCKAFLTKHLKNDNPELTFDFVSFKAERYNTSFTVQEDKF